MIDETQYDRNLQIVNKKTPSEWTRIWAIDSIKRGIGRLKIVHQFLVMRAILN